MPVIDSPRNPRIKAALELRDRKARIETRRTLVDGARESRRVIEAGARVEVAFVCDALATGPDAVEALRALAGRGVEIIEVSERVHDRLAFGNRGDGLVLVAGTPDVDLGSLRPGPDPLILVIEDVEKPGNLGAILRTADAVGCDAVIAVGGTDLFNPNVVRSSVGTVFSVPVAAAGAADALAWLRTLDIRLLAARVDATLAYTEADLRGSLALVLGSEADGLSPAWQDSSIVGVRLPMHGLADSVNVSVAAAVLAFEARRQRDLPSEPSRSVP
jgi:RNA methyltransferase, TrmH family